MTKLQAWHWNNLAHEHLLQHCRGQEMRSLVRLFLRPSLLVSTTRLLRCPRGAGEQSGFGTSHSLSSQGLWPSADYTTNCSHIPSALLFGQLWIFTCYECNSVRHATVHSDIVSCVVCIWRIWSFSHFLSDFEPNHDFKWFCLSNVLHCYPTKTHHEPH